MEAGTRIREYIRAATFEAIADDDDFFQLGVVDSLFAIQLIMFVEKEFSIVTEREELSMDNFCSILALTRFVQRKSPPTDPSAEHANEAD